jgi:hypothetical protein
MGFKFIRFREISGAKGLILTNEEVSVAVQQASAQKGISLTPQKVWETAPFTSETLQCFLALHAETGGKIDYFTPLQKSLLAEAERAWNAGREDMVGQN